MKKKEKSVKTDKAVIKMQTAANTTTTTTSATNEEKKAPRNQVILTGHLGKDPQVDELDGGRKKAFFTLATNQPFTSKTGVELEDTHWHSLVAWGKLAEQVGNFLRKGDKISVTGRIHYRNYTDKNGAKKLFTEIVMQSLIILPKPQTASA